MIFLIGFEQKYKGIIPDIKLKKKFIHKTLRVFLNGLFLFENRDYFIFKNKVTFNLKLDRRRNYYLSYTYFIRDTN